MVALSKKPNVRTQQIIFPMQRVGILAAALLTILIHVQQITIIKFLIMDGATNSHLMVTEMVDFGLIIVLLQMEENLFVLH